MKISRIAIVAATLVVAACQPKGDAADAAKDPSKAVVATIDGKSITRGTFDFYVKAATGQDSKDLPPEQQQRALDSLISLHLVAAKAQSDKLDQAGDLAAQLELTRLNILQQAAAEGYLKDKTPTEQELRAEYDAQVARLSPNEYRARHILVSTEIAANQILDRLRKGERFETLARDSLDATRDRGGDLGWFSPTSMVKPFADAVMALKKGETIAKPVQTQFGWHVIRLDDTRPVQPPPFEQVQQQISQSVLAKKFQAYSDELAKAAKIEKKL
ncbi:MAG: peptidylprolyl isomerase [Steroidobacteraceae bacterium]